MEFESGLSPPQKHVLGRVGSSSDFPDLVRSTLAAAPLSPGRAAGGICAAPDSMEALGARVRLRLAKGELGPALKLCKESVSRNPRPENLQLLAQVREVQGDLTSTEAAIRICEQRPATTYTFCARDRSNGAPISPRVVKRKTSRGRSFFVRLTA